jgi:hypothetical protein
MLYRALCFDVFLGLELGLRLSGGRLVDRSTVCNVLLGGICLLDDMVKGCHGEGLATSSRCESLH